MLGVTGRSLRVAGRLLRVAGAMLAVAGKTLAITGMMLAVVGKTLAITGRAPVLSILRAGEPEYIGSATRFGEMPKEGARRACATLTVWLARRASAVHQMLAEGHRR
jgi:hypothetical protein